MVLLGRLEETILRLSFQENHPKLCSTIGLMGKQAAASSPLSNYVLPGAQSDCNHSWQRHQCHFCIRNSTLQTIPVSPNHAALLPSSPAKECTMQSFPSHYALLHQNRTQMCLMRRVQVACLCPSCKGGGEGTSLLSSNITWWDEERENSPNIRSMFKRHWVPKFRTNVYQNEWLRLSMTGVGFF